MSHGIAHILKKLKKGDFEIKTFWSQIHNFGPKWRFLEKKDHTVSWYI
jgi:hypothetical protein